MRLNCFPTTATIPTAPPSAYHLAYLRRPPWGQCVDGVPIRPGSTLLSIWSWIALSLLTPLMWFVHSLLLHSSTLRSLPSPWSRRPPLLLQRYPVKEYSSSHSVGAVIRHHQCFRTRLHVSWPSVVVPLCHGWMGGFCLARGRRRCRSTVVGNVLTINSYVMHMLV